MPCGRSPSSVVITATPVAKWPIAARSSALETVIPAGYGEPRDRLFRDYHRRMRTDTTTGTPATRIERDSMGEMDVPADALYGASTQRAVLNFPISGQPMPPRFLRALALIKLAAAETNAELGLLDGPKAR